MRTADLEEWVLRIVDLVESGRIVEDARIELKREWPDDMNKSARQIAGHANASQGEYVLWIIGLDEVDGLVTFTTQDPNQWLLELGKEFDGVAPASTELIVPANGSEVVALLFDTSRVPYVVRNANHGRPGGKDPIAWEVPWRSNASTRSAKRQDLLRLLVPLTKKPRIDILGAQLLVRLSGGELPDGAGYEPTTEEMNPHLVWGLTIKLYVMPVDHSSVTFPRHLASIILTIGEREVIFNDFGLAAPTKWTGSETVTDSLSVRTTRYETQIDGPGLVEINSYTITSDNLEVPSDKHATVDLEIGTAWESVVIRLSVPLDHKGVLKETHMGEDYRHECYRFQNIRPRSN